MDGILAAELSTVLKGWGVTILGSLVFFGSAYILLAAIFGRWMGYLVTAVSFWGMMIIFSIIFVLGVPGSTPPNLGPRGTRYSCPTCISEPHWAPVAVAENITSPAFDAVARYPASPWEPPDAETTPEIEGLTTAMGQFLAREVNPEQELPEGDVEAGEGAPAPAHEIAPTDFALQNIRFTTAEDGTRLAAAQVYFKEGGPILEAFAIFDTGNVPLPSWLFLGASTLLFAGHLPFLDKAEKKRKDILTGGEAPKFLGPA
jgi:hypothetical protein